jgi:hypothetical protein
MIKDIGTQINAIIYNKVRLCICNTDQYKIHIIIHYYLVCEAIGSDYW